MKNSNNETNKKEQKQVILKQKANNLSMAISIVYFGIPLLYFQFGIQSLKYIAESGFFFIASVYKLFYLVMSGKLPLLIDIILMILFSLVCRAFISSVQSLTHRDD